ncbi:MAG: MFS transporter [Gammaproteobacteria bacterium]|nr:MFS transporter [Gammaproteobacteria bacterium]
MTPRTERSLGAFYFTYFLAAGAFFPFFSLFLEYRGLGPAAIGELLAVTTLAKLVAPYLWGAIADARGRRLDVVRMACVAATVAFSALYFVEGFWLIAIAMVVYSFFWNACLPQVEAMTLHALGSDTHRYTRIRIWGSVGFIVAVLGVGALLERAPISVLPLVVVAIMALVCIVAVAMREPPATAVGESAPGNLREVLTRPSVVALFVACFLMQASHGAYYGFFALYLSRAGYSEVLIGALWALGVVAEVLIFWLMPKLLKRWGAGLLFVGCFVLTTLRWFMLGYFVDWFAVVVVAQAMHAASYGVHHAVAILLIHRAFHTNLRGRGQALYSSLTYAAGTAVGSLISGYVWEAFGARHAFTVAAAMSAIGMGVAFVLATGAAHRWLFRDEAEVAAS